MMQFLITIVELLLNQVDPLIMRQWWQRLINSSEYMCVHVNEGTKGEGGKESAEER